MAENTYKQNLGAPAQPSHEKDEYGQDEAMSAEESRKKIVVRAVITVLAILVGILLVLFLVSWVALYDSIPEMLSDMGAQLGEVVRRVFA